MLLSRTMPSGVPRVALVIVPLVAVLFSSRAALLPDSHPTHFTPVVGAPNFHSTHSSNPAWNTRAHVNNEHKYRLQRQAQRFLDTQRALPTLKSELRQVDDNNNASDALDQFLSSMQPQALTPSSPQSADDGTVIEVEEQVSPTPVETGPVIVLESETSPNSDNDDDRDVDVAHASITDVDDVPKPTESVEIDDELSASPEALADFKDVAQMESRGQPISPARETDLQNDSNADNASQSTSESTSEEDEPEPEPSPSNDDAASIFGALPALFDGSSIAPADGNVPSATPTPSELSKDAMGSGESVTPLAVATTAQNETSRIQLDMSVRSTSVTTVSRDFDESVREYLASETGTAVDEWKAVFVSAAEEIKDRGATFFVWGLKYQGVLSSSDLDGDVKRLQARVFSGELEAFLRSALGTDDITLQLFNNIQRDVQDEPRVTFEDIGAVSSEGQPTSNENAATGGTLGESEATNNADGNGEAGNVGLIVGTSLGVVALLALGGIAVVLGKRRSNSPRHTIDGEEEVPPTLTSFHSVTTTDSTPSRFQTGAPVNPRGATMLRNQSRLLDWRAEQAAAADRESRVEILE